MPSLLFLLLCLGLCLFFGIGAIERFHDYILAQAELKQEQARLDWLQEREERLKEARERVESEKERAAREEGLGARPGETVIEVPSAPWMEGNAERAMPSADIPSWRQWWDLFFSPTPE